MLVQYIKSVQTLHSDSFTLKDARLWECKNSKEYAMSKYGYRQLKFSCAACIHGHRTQKCLHYTKPLLFVKERGQHSNNPLNNFLTPVIDPTVELKFALNDIPRCPSNPSFSILGCTNKTCNCTNEMGTLVLDMDFIPLRIIHNGLDKLIPSTAIGPEDCAPFLGSVLDRHPYRMWQLEYSTGNNYSEEELKEAIERDDELFEDDTLKRKLVSLDGFNPVEKIESAGKRMMSKCLQATITKDLVTDYKVLDYQLQSINSPDLPIKKRKLLNTISKAHITSTVSNSYPTFGGKRPPGRSMSYNAKATLGGQASTILPVPQDNFTLQLQQPVVIYNQVALDVNSSPFNTIPSYNVPAEAPVSFITGMQSAFAGESLGVNASSSSSSLYVNAAQATLNSSQQATNGSYTMPQSTRDDTSSVSGLNQAGVANCYDFRPQDWTWMPFTDDQVGSSLQLETNTIAPTNYNNGAQQLCETEMDATLRLLEEIVNMPDFGDVLSQDDSGFQAIEQFNESFNPDH